MQICVFNKNRGMSFKDKYAGIEYMFPAMSRTFVDSDVAQHIFGYGLSEADRFKKVMRMGMANLPNWKEYWSRIEFIVPTGKEEREAA